MREKNNKEAKIRTKKKGRSSELRTEHQIRLQKELELALSEQHDESVRKDMIKREKNRRKRSQINTLFWILVFLMIGAMLVMGVVLFRSLVYLPESRSAALILDEKVALGIEETENLQGDVIVAETDSEYEQEADRLAAMYDYQAAIDLLMSDPTYAGSLEKQDKVISWQQQKAALKPYPIDQITHVFFHTMTYKDELAFDGDSDEAGYNQYMTTIPEFNKIIQSMYDRGYVMVSLHDMMGVNDDGSMYQKEILLPEGKIPFVLSQDDVSYYHYMYDDGFPSRLVLNENGEVKCEYIEADGSVTLGDYDMVPLIDSFVDEHPDFSYHGHKGVLAMTGYDGVLGYRTDIAYKTRENLDEYQEEFFKRNPDFNEQTYEEECRQAKIVADAMKADGWEFASHTWGHLNATASSAEKLQTDDGKWKAYVAPILGDTDIVIFAFGADIGDWTMYSMDNEKFAYFKNAGYNYYCNVDASRVWVQIGPNYLRQGRRNLDGYRMYYDMINDDLDNLSDLFDVNEVFDPVRPTPVPAL